MRSFEDREKGFEAEIKRNQDLAFRVTARRNRLFGMWVAEQLGLPADQAEPYARTVVEADFFCPVSPPSGPVIERYAGAPWPGGSFGSA